MNVPFSYSMIPLLLAGIVADARAKGKIVDPPPRTECKATRLAWNRAVSHRAWEARIGKVTALGRIYGEPLPWPRTLATADDGAWAILLQPIRGEYDVVVLCGACAERVRAAVIG